MTSPPGAIPVRLAPLPGEDLDSYLHAYAHRLHAGVCDILALAGLAARWDTGRLTRGHRPWAYHLDPAERGALAAVTGVPAEALAEMTLARYDGTGLAVVDTTTRSPRHPRWWRHLARPRFCPRCLAGNGGRWMLAWWLPWAFACTRHHVLLADVCPGCGRHHRPAPSRPPRSPGCCETTGLPLPPPPHPHKAPSCSFPLAETPAAPLDPAGPVASAQRRVDILTAALVQARRGAPDRLPAIRRRLDDLHATARAALSALGTPATPPEAVDAVLADLGIPAAPDRTGWRRARGTALGTAVAHLMLGERPGDPDPTIIGWLLDAAARRTRASPELLLQRWANASPELQGALLAGLAPRMNIAHRLRYSTAAPLPRRPRAGGAARAAAVPSLFWRGWALRLNPPGLFAPVPYRAALSALLLLAGTADLDYRHALALLGNAPAASAHSSHFTRGLRRAGALDTVISVLGRLADTLDEQGSPIDYTRRRMLADPTFDEDAWRDRCLEIGRRGLTRPHQVRFARSYLAELLTGTHPCHLPGPARMAAPGSARYAEFAAAVPEPLEAYLHDCAEQILNRAGIDEPVEWEPPFDWVTDVAWPGPDPTATPRGILWARTSTRSPSTPPAEPGTTAGPAPPGAEELRAWAEQGLSPRRIAAVTGCPRPLIARLLAEAGLARPTAREVLSTLDPAWLREQYEARHRTFDEIAAELGIHSCELNAHARTLGITTRRGGASRRHILADHGGPAAFPAAVWAAFTGHRADQHIRRILATPGHPNLSRAARALGVRQSGLTYQLRRVERAVGAEILRRDDNGGGITFTPAGEQFARDVRPVLDLLDHITKQ